MQTLFMGAYWSARNESLAKCAERVTNWFSCLDQIATHPVTWWDPIDRGQQPRKRVFEGVRDVREWLATGRNLTDANKRPIYDLGFSKWLDLRTQMAVTGQIHIACGGYSKYVGNVVNYSRSGKDNLFNSPAQLRCSAQQQQRGSPTGQGG